MLLLVEDLVWSFECESVPDGARQENPLNINIYFIFYCKILYLRIRVEVATRYTSTQLRQALQTTALYFDWLVKVDCEQRLDRVALSPTTHMLVGEIISILKRIGTAW